MSNNDSFIDEVTEEVRRDRLFAFFRRYMWIGILGVALIVGGTGWNEWQKRQARIAAETFGDALFAAVEMDAAALQAVPATGDQRAVVAMLASTKALDAGDRAGAAAALAAIGADLTLPALYRDLAELKRVLILGPAMDAVEREAILARLAVPGAPYRPLAMEQQALALLTAGDRPGAIALLQQVRQEAGVSEALQARVVRLIVALGGVAG